MKGSHCCNHVAALVAACLIRSIDADCYGISGTSWQEGGANGKCIILQTQDKKWEEAQTLCQSMGPPTPNDGTLTTRLALLDNADYYNGAVAVLNDASEAQAHIGAKGSGSGTAMEWFVGATACSAAVDPATGETLEQTGAAKECMDLKDDGTYKQVKCDHNSDKRPYLCEVAPVATSGAGAASGTSDECPVATSTSTTTSTSTSTSTTTTTTPTSTSTSTSSTTSSSTTTTSSSTSTSTTTPTSTSTTTMTPTSTTTSTSTTTTEPTTTETSTTTSTSTTTPTSTSTMTTTTPTSTSTTTPATSTTTTPATTTLTSTGTTTTTPTTSTSTPAPTTLTLTTATTVAAASASTTTPTSTTTTTECAWSSLSPCSDACGYGYQYSTCTVSGVEHVQYRPCSTGYCKDYSGESEHAACVSLGGYYARHSCIYPAPVASRLWQDSFAACASATAGGQLARLHDTGDLFERLAAFLLDKYANRTYFVGGKMHGNFAKWMKDEATEDGSYVALNEERIKPAGGKQCLSIVAVQSETDPTKRIPAHLQAASCTAAESDAAGALCVTRTRYMDFAKSAGGKRLEPRANNTPPLHTLAAASEWLCGLACKRADYGCLGYNYQPSTNVCELAPVKERLPKQIRSKAGAVKSLYDIVDAAGDFHYFNRVL